MTFVPWSGLLAGAVAMGNPVAVAMGFLLMGLLTATTFALILPPQTTVPRPREVWRSLSFAAQPAPLPAPDPLSLVTAPDPRVTRASAKPPPALQPPHHNPAHLKRSCARSFPGTGRHRLRTRDASASDRNGRMLPRTLARPARRRASA